MNLDNTNCDKPGCTDSATKTYSGNHDNQLRICPPHYWELVTGKTVSKAHTGVGFELGLGSGSLELPSRSRGRSPLSTGPATLDPFSEVTE